MPERLTCSNGHQWDQEVNGPAVCPSCGAPGTVATSVLTPLNDFGTLKTTEWDQLQSLLSRFEVACRDSPSADLARYLPPPDHALRPIALKELIRVDLEMRWRRGQAITTEQYLARFPELAGRPEEMPSLLCDEYRARKAFGDKPSLTSFQERFPEHFSALKLLVKEAPALSPSDAIPQGGPSSRQSLPIGSGYKLIKRIGCGSFGEVWLGEAPGGIAVAIKMIFRPVDHEEGQRELQSLELIKGLRHPFLMQTQAYWALEDRLYIVMELADATLRDRQKQCLLGKDSPGIPRDELLHYMSEAAEALDYLHSQGVLHRDVKPDNLLLVTGERGQEGGKPSAAPAPLTPAPLPGGERGRGEGSGKGGGPKRYHIKVADFGLARVWESQRLSASGSGTPAYMAPEIWVGKVSQHSDQYSLAVTYAELRMGRRLFSGANMLALKMEHCEQRPDMPELEKAEQQVILKALHKDPNRRYENCAAFVQALRKCVPGSSADASPPPPPPPRSKARLALGLLGVLFTVVLIGWLARDLIWPPVVQEGFDLRPPEPFAVTAGDAKPLTLFLERQNFTEAVALRFSGLPEHVAIADTEIPAHVTRVQVPVQTHWQANLSGAKAISAKVLIHAEAGELRQEIPLELSVEPAVMKWPSEWATPDDAQLCIDADNMKYPDRFDVVKGGLRVRFRLVPRVPPRPVGPDVRSFYIMQDKVSVELFRLFAEEHPKEVPDDEWKKPGYAGEDYPKDKHPVFGVPVQTAHAFAQWLSPKGLSPKGGLLPSLDEWDEAAGRYAGEGAPGPFKAPWAEGEIAVGRKGPMECGAAKHDISWRGCNDMAGNGQEWTRNWLYPNSKDEIPLNREAGELDLVSVRGRSYRESAPLLFDQLIALPRSKRYGKKEPEVGFRVVIER